MSQRYWKIEGYEGTKKIFERSVKIGTFSEKQIQVVLKALVAQGDLSLDEIVGAYARKNSVERNELLEIRRDGAPPIFTCGLNPHFVARVVAGDDL